MTSRIILSSFFLILGILTSCSTKEIKEKPNVLLIICDDLNDWALHPDGHPLALTPNLDRFAGQGVTFSNAFVSVPVCGPSRKCLFSGLQPQTLNDYHFDPWAESPVLENCTALPEYFLQNGYGVFGAGKLLHEGSGGDFYTEYGYGVDYGPHPWRGIGPTEFTPYPTQYEKWKDFLPLLDMHRDLNYAPLSDVPVWEPDPEGNYPGARGWFYASGEAFRYENEQTRDPMPDEISAGFAVDILGREHEKPFFLAVGFVRPHTPLYAPKEYFDRFPLEQIELPPYMANDLDDCAPVLKERWQWGFQKYDALLNAGGEMAWKEWVQAYLACMAFVDEQIGQVLDALNNSPYGDNTIVIITSDNGYHIGEKNCIQKWHLWDESTRVPLFIRDPRSGVEGQRCMQPVTLINLYPTLVDLCELPEQPHLPLGGPPLDGHSLRPFLEDPELEHWDGPAVALMAIRDKDEDPHFSVCSRRYRYTLCANGQEELYDHLEDPNEWTNLAGRPDFEEIKIQLRNELEMIVNKKAY